MSISEHTITVNELPVTVVRKNIKNLHLAVYPPNGRVRIAVPNRMDDEAVRLAVISRLSWIKDQIQSFTDQSRQSAFEYTGGESHYYLGNRYLLDISHTVSRPFVRIHRKKKLVLHINRDSGVNERERLLTNWYRNEMKQILPNIIQKWEKETGLQVQSYGIKRMKTKWGSCNPCHKRIWLNLELIKKPINCLEYIVVHEMVHFLEHTHNHIFISHMDRILPQWRRLRKELNQTPLAYENWKH